MGKGGREYRSVQIPESLIKSIKKIIQETKLGYRSHSEFIIDCVRRRVETLLNELREENI
jgi:metal-responsive CopG/Arc/MetJ family transcriptional regulator